MRKLIILRGVMGSGKSTFISENHLEMYTLSTDKIRLMFNTPELTVDYIESMTQFNNHKVWDLLYSILEDRMRKGEFTIIDAMNLIREDLNIYKKLAEKYRYRLYIVDFSDVPKEVLYERNNSREECKRISTKSIDKAYKKMKKETIPSVFQVIKPNEFNDIVKNIPKDVNDYEKIHIIGDIHGCASVIKRYFERYPLSEKELYIFLGDYFDKGIENYETYLYLNQIIKNKNTIFLLGNHEDKLYKYAYEDDFKMDYDISKTIEEFEKNNLKKSELRGFIKQLAQMSYIEFRGTRYLITHGGIPYLPNKPLDFYSTNSFVYGIDKYEVNIDEVYNNFMKQEVDKVYQIHGHRNYQHIPYDEYPYSINLDGSVETGGSIRILTINSDGSKEYLEMSNEVYNKTLIENESVYALINELRNNKYIYEKELDNDISSFNFTKEAFFNGLWNNMTTKARGLFIDTKEYNIVARSYNKFFNIDETKDTRLEVILDSFSYPISFYLKYNGFLGILTIRDDELLFASKSNIKGPHVDYFKDIFYKIYDENKIKAIKEYMINNNVSLIFEVIDPINDPHIIEYKESNIILLDAIKNTIEYSKIPYEELKSFANSNNIFIKELVYILKDKDELWNLYYEINKDDYKFNDRYIEGYVIEDSNNFMVKYKTNYYRRWKFLRNKMENSIKDNNFTIKSNNDLEISFMRFIEDKYKDKDNDISKINIIDERNDFFNRE